MFGSSYPNRSSDLVDASSYFLFGVWRDHGDPKIMDMPLMAFGPWYFFSIALSFVAFIKVLGPALMADRKPFELKPYLMVFNGLLFGGYGAFFAGVSVFTGFGHEGFNCRAADPNSELLYEIIIRLLGYVYLVGKCADFVVPVFRVLLKKDVSDLMLGHTLLMVGLTYLGLIYYPGNLFFFLPYGLLDALYYSLLHGYLVMATPASHTYRPRADWARMLHNFRVTMFAFCALHAMYFYLKPDCGPDFLKLLQLGYSLLAVACLLLTEKNHQKRASFCKLH